MRTQGFESLCLICRQRAVTAEQHMHADGRTHGYAPRCRGYHGATGSMSHASTTDARATPPTANSRTAVLSARVG